MDSSVRCRCQLYSLASIVVNNCLSGISGHAQLHHKQGVNRARQIKLVVLPLNHASFASCRARGKG